MSLLTSKGFPGGSEVKESAHSAGDLDSLGWEGPLERKTATHSSIPAWKTQLAEEPGELQSMGLQRVKHNQVTNTYTQQRG